uniref:Putative secreted protein n=1 Tax=Anopheles triannulatus TaxID=58253 RepID=A0A2M4B450_9DIPT
MLMQLLLLLLLLLWDGLWLGAKNHSTGGRGIGKARLVGWSLANASTISTRYRWQWSDACYFELYQRFGCGRHQCRGVESWSGFARCGRCCYGRSTARGCC